MPHFALDFFDSVNVEKKDEKKVLVKRLEEGQCI